MTGRSPRRAASKTTPTPCRAHLVYTGRVQGVGFRYTAERLALELGLTGWVRNLRDGSVELVCEGPKERIESLLERIAASPLGAHIRKTRCTWQTPTGEFDDFRVEFCL